MLTLQDLWLCTKAVWAPEPPKFHLRFVKTRKPQFSKPLTGPRSVRLTNPLPDTTYYEFEVLNWDTLGYTHPFRVSIAVLTETNRVVGNGTITRSTPGLVCPEEWGSEGLGVLLLSIPLGVVAFPYLYYLNLKRKWIERRHQMSYYGVTVLKSIIRVPDSEDAIKALGSAFRSTWAEDGVCTL